jgi:NADPH2:quinone reductase
LGNEGAGIVVDAGSEVKGMVGKTVGLAGGGMYCQYRCMPANNCLIMNEQTTAEEAASSFVNPMTALGFIETMKLEGHQALIHTAASSNLGKMLIKICKDDSIPLINIVRDSKQIQSLKNIGAKFVFSTSDENFDDNLTTSIKETGATLAFDATGGGNEGMLVGQILSAMERALLSSSEEYQIYGSDTLKQVYVYGGLDRSPTILNRSYGMSWSIGGWLLMPMINKFGMEKFHQMRERVAAEIKTTFASNYYKSISFEEALKPDIIRSYATQTTGKKYLIKPHKE